jgi:hypothetical protein
MKPKCFFIASNGMGDKVLDIIGVYVLCEYLGFCPIVRLNDSWKQHFDWGTNHYDPRLFENQHLLQDNTNTECVNRIISVNPSSSLCPFKVYQYLLDHGHAVSFQEINRKYQEYAKSLIRPSSPIIERLPQVLENTYGIHLRKSDKIKSQSQGFDIRHENGADEFGIIIENLMSDIQRLIQVDPDSSFLVVSEDKAWKKTIEEYIENEGGRFLVLDYSNPGGYDNFESVLDMFALSRCKTIIQGVKYSAFSILAALIGQGKLMNYSPMLESNTKCLIYTWNSVVEINGEYIENPYILSYMTKGICEFYMTKGIS